MNRVQVGSAAVAGAVIVVALLSLSSPPVTLSPGGPSPLGPANSTTVNATCDMAQHLCVQDGGAGRINLTWQAFQIYSCEPLANGSTKVQVSVQWLNNGNATAFNATVNYRVVWNTTSGSPAQSWKPNTFGANSQQINIYDFYVEGDPCANARAFVRGEILLEGLPPSGDV